jgi:signal transduction histidine kinase
MTIRKSINGILDRIFGISRLDLSEYDAKRALLTAQLCVISIVTLTVSIFIDLVNYYFFPVLFDLGAIVLSFVALWLNRHGKFMAAKILLILTINTLVLFLISRMPLGMGFYLYSTCITIGILIAIGYERMKLAALLALGSALAFLLVMSISPTDPEASGSDADFVYKNLMITFFVSGTANATMIFYLLRDNFLYEQMLIRKDNDLLTKNKQLEAANVKLDRFFYSTSHDLRAPLNSMQGLVQLMEMSNDIKELHSYANLLKGRVHNMDNFIKKFSEYAKSSRQEITVETINLRQFVMDNLDNLIFFGHSDRVRRIVDIPERLVIETDSIRLQTVLGNLFSNAIKYHDYSKAAPYLRVGYQEVRGRHCIEVSDNGIGMSTNDLDRIFGMFFRVNHDIEGTGLGLFIVKEALERIGGTIEVSSEPGVGTRFTVSLPMTP